MTTEQMHIAILESMGWKQLSYIVSDEWSPDNGKRKFYWKDLSGAERELPPLTLDLMHDAVAFQVEKGGDSFLALFNLNLQQVIQRRHPDLQRHQIAYWMHEATALQRAEAYLRTIGQWKEQE